MQESKLKEIIIKSNKHLENAIATCDSSPSVARSIIKVGIFQFLH